MTAIEQDFHVVPLFYYAVQDGYNFCKSAYETLVCGHSIEQYFHVVLFISYAVQGGSDF